MKITAGSRERYLRRPLSGEASRRARCRRERDAGLRLSVIVPARSAGPLLQQTLPALVASDYPRGRWELIVVNDGDDPDTEAVASRYADVVLGLPGRARGPAYARNRGAEIAQGQVLVFVDADVRVHENTLRLLAEAFEADAAVGAVFGSYDDRPEAPGLVSRYRNLLHHSVHQLNAGEAETFWAGCGAVRASVFAEVGMFDEWHFARPQIEDIELGRRIRHGGYRILLDGQIQGTHLKCWRLREVLLSDLKHRGVPWARLLLHEGWRSESHTLNLTARHRWCVGFASMIALAVPLALVTWDWRPLLIVGAAVLGVVLMNLRFYGVLRRQCGWYGAAAGVPLHLLHYFVSGLSMVLGWLVYSLVGPPHPPADVAAFEEVGVDTWPPVPVRPRNSVWYHYGQPKAGRRGSRKETGPVDLPGEDG